MSSWFPTGQNDSPGWRLDVVSLLAVIGESAVKANAQPLTASSLCLLPRLVPATQGLFCSTRPARLPPLREKVTGIHSGVRATRVSFFATLLHPLEHLRPYEFRAYRVQYRGDPARGRITAAAASPAGALTLASALWSAALAVWAGVLGDGCALVAVLVLSAAASVIGAARGWRPRLVQRRARARVPAGDVVIETAQGAFVVVRCSEDVARELYVGGEFCEYWVGEKGFKALSGVATMLFMVGVILLGNCGDVMQIATGATFVALNGLYWGLTLVPARLSWRVERFEVEDVTPDAFRDAHVHSEREDASFTRTLWYAIHTSGSADWVVQSGAAPQHPTWRTWLALARENIKRPDWPAVRVKDRLFHAATAADDKAEIRKTSTI